MKPLRLAVLSLFALSAAAATSTHDAAASGPDVRVDVHSFRVFKRDSGPVNYYTVVDDPVMPYLRAKYTYPNETTVLGYQVTDAERPGLQKLRWNWRANTLPVGGNECADGKEDSAAVVYLTWKRGFKYYTLKYVWSSVGTKGQTCGRKRNPFVAQDTIIMESGGPTGAWKSEEIDMAAEFRAHFENGDPKAEIPDFGGIAIMTDGDQTKSESSADYAGFVFLR
ncbi:MAG: DUF3047 domain-containing protein [Polyangiaceae bacterium]